MKFHYKNSKDIHIGSIIEHRIRAKSINISEFADMLNCERSTVYAIFKRKSIDIVRLMQISELLDYDFFMHIYEDRDENL
jgi:plasmid maintenance system antidote protein VapI